MTLQNPLCTAITIAIVFPALLGLRPAMPALASAPAGPSGALGRG